MRGPRSGAGSQQPSRRLPTHSKLGRIPLLNRTTTTARGQTIRQVAVAEGRDCRRVLLRTTTLTLPASNTMTVPMFRVRLPLTRHRRRGRHLRSRLTRLRDDVCVVS